MLRRSEFGKKLRQHDWYYGFADDHRSWTKGRDQAKVIRDLHENHACPFNMEILRIWAHNNILEEFVEEEPDQWYRQPRKYKCIAALSRKDLITQAEHDEITQWLTLGATVEELAQYA